MKRKRISFLTMLMLAVILLMPASNFLWGHIYIRCDIKSHNKLPPVSYFTI